LIQRIFLIAAVCICLSISHSAGGHASDAGTDAADNSTDTTQLTSQQLGLGFGLTFLAAGFSSLGALIPIIDLYILSKINPSWVLLENKMFFAGTMAFAGGLLLALSLWDLTPDAVDSLADSGYFEPQHAGLVVVACVLCGMLVIAFTSWLSVKLAPKGIKPCACDTMIGDAIQEEPVVQKKEEVNPEDCGCGCDPDAPPGGECKCESMAEPEPITVIVNPPKMTESSDKNSTKEREDLLHEEGDEVHEQQVNLYKFGLQMAVAIAIHNIPEGLATFITVVKSTGVGAIFGVALCIHKIPEGLIISLPIYHATQSRWKTFLITLLIGVCSQPIGAAIGYAVVKTTDYNDGAGGLVLSIVAGCMIYISVKGMLPMARMYDPKDRCTTICTLVGVLFMMFSSSIFSYSGLNA